MALVLCKDNRLSETVSTFHFNSAFHQILEHRIYRCFIENKLIHGCGRYKFRDMTVLDEILLISFLILIRQVIIISVLCHSLCLHLIIVIWHQNMILIDSGFVIIGIGRYTMLHFKEFIGVPVNIGFRSCRQANHNCIEIRKYCTVFLENAPVTLVDYDQIKMGWSKQAHTILALRIINCIQHGRISRKDNTGITVILVTAKVAERHIRKIILKIILCLFHKRSPICQK